MRQLIQYQFLSEIQGKMGAKKSNPRYGKWTKIEKDNFLKSLYKYGRNWIEAQKKIQTRTIGQVRSYAQKYFSRLPVKDRKALQQQMSNKELTTSRINVDQRIRRGPREEPLKKEGRNYQIQYLQAKIVEQNQGEKVLDQENEMNSQKNVRNQALVEEFRPEIGGFQLERENGSNNRKEFDENAILNNNLYGQPVSSNYYYSLINMGNSNTYYVCMSLPTPDSLAGYYF